MADKCALANTFYYILCSSVLFDADFTSQVVIFRKYRTIAF